MTGKLRLFGLLAAVATAFGLASAAQAETGQPGGTWSSNCYDASVDRGVLYATCADKKNREVDAEIDLTACNANVRNDNGRLRCYGTPGVLPDGQWTESCTDAYIAQGYLWAICEDKKGREREASLRLTNCPVAQNDNGRLICGAAQPQRPMPGGSWGQTCRNGQIAGSVLTAECLDTKGKYRYSQLDLNTCGGKTVENVNGQLVCGLS